jgi:FtsH-binding integral membrane protein
MTPGQVSKLKGWTYAMVGAAIACFVVAYPYATSAAGRADPPPEVAPYLFAGLGIACLVAAAVLARKISKSGKPAATTDLKGPQGKKVISLLIVGLIALAALTIINFMVPNGDFMWLTVLCVLLLVVDVCFVTAGSITRRIRRDAAIV